MRVSKVKLSLLVFSFCIVMGSITGNVQANPPRDIVPEFDSSTKILKMQHLWFLKEKNDSGIGHERFI